MNDRDRQDHYVDALRYAMLSFPRVKWYFNVKRFIKASCKAILAFFKEVLS